MWEDLLQELTHEVMQAGKSHSLQSATWRTRKARDIDWSKDENQV